VFAIAGSGGVTRAAIGATASEYRLEVKVTRWIAVTTSTSLCLATTACFHDRSQPQEDIAGRLETVAVAQGPPSYFLGRSYAGIDLSTVEPAGSKALADGERAYFEYGTCEYVDDSGCSPPIEVVNEPLDGVEGIGSNLRWITPSFCRNHFYVRGVPAVISEGMELDLFTGDSYVSIYKGADNSPGGDVRSMAEALRPVSGPADVTRPLPDPVKDVLDTIAEQCG
jgi:hypothetical protein